MDNTLTANDVISLMATIINKSKDITFDFTDVDAKKAKKRIVIATSNSENVMRYIIYNKAPLSPRKTRVYIEGDKTTIIDPDYENIYIGISTNIIIKKGTTQALSNDEGIVKDDSVFISFLNKIKKNHTINNSLKKMFPGKQIFVGLISIIGDRNYLGLHLAQENKIEKERMYPPVEHNNYLKADTIYNHYLFQKYIDEYEALRIDITKQLEQENLKQHKHKLNDILEDFDYLKYKYNVFVDMTPKFNGRKKASARKVIKYTKTNRKHKDTDGVSRVLYEHEGSFYVKKKSKESGKFMYKKVTI